MNKILYSKVKRILNGEKVIVSEKEYDEIIDEPVLQNFNEFRYLVSIWNPNRCGINDALIAYLKNFDNK